MADKICVNGKFIELTAEEMAQMQKQAAIAEAQEKFRPMTDTEVSRMVISAQINTLDVDDNTALRMVQYYPEWMCGKDYTVGFKVQRSGKLYRAVQAHTAQEGWEPENAASLWEQVNETHTGELSDPIPYDGNMALEKEKYYIQNGEIYRCISDTVYPVYHPLVELVGMYVEIA